MTSLVAPFSAQKPRGSAAAASSFLRVPAPACADRVCVDPSRVLMQADAAGNGKRRRRHGDGDYDESRASKKQAVVRVASPVAHLSCARIRPFVRASRPKEEIQVTARAVIKKHDTGESISCKKIGPAVQASRPKKETASSTLVSARAVAHGVIAKQKAGENVPCSRIKPTVAKQPSGLKDKTKFPCALGILRNDAVSKTKPEAGERVQATATTSIPPLSHPASATKVRSDSIFLHKEAQRVIKTKQKASERVQATSAKSTPQIRLPAPAANHQDPYAAQDAVRAALAIACQARDRRQQNVYRQQREEARRELDKVVRTVFFNDPYITLDDVLKP